VSIPTTEKPRITLLCGCPGAGKSTFFLKKLLPLGYERINQDILRTVRIHVSFRMSAKPIQRERCLKVAAEFLKEGKSVAIGEPSLLLRLI
jgi:bifunctional polynucleotide phosphatase/kinase